MNEMIVNQDYWDSSYEGYKFARLPKFDPTKAIIEKYVPLAVNDEQVFELGCFPGRFLVEIGQKGYVLNGCDLTPLIIKELESWCLKNNCKVNQFYQGSYSDFIDHQYEFVASFGFIEHFENYGQVFLSQCSMVKDGGLLLVQFPNFRGLIQNILHRFFDIDNLNNHVVSSMNLNFYKKNIPNEFDVIYCSYYGGFDFWIDDYKNRNGKFKKLLLKLFYKTSRFWKYLPNSSFYSPYAVLIARKKKS